MRHVRTIVVLMTVGALLPIGVGWSGAAVLCRDIDGYVEVETAVFGVCLSDADRSGETGTTGEATYTISCRDAHSEPCVDVPFTIGARAASKSMGHDTRIEVKVPALNLLLEMDARTTTPVFPVAFASGEIPPNPMLPHLRTVTLRV